MNYLLMALYFVLTSSALILMKLGLEGVKFSINSKSFLFSLTWQFVLGGIFYVISFVLFSILMSKMKLGNIYSISVGIIYILVMILSWLILKEKITFLGIIGSILILIGIIIMNWRR